MISSIIDICTYFNSKDVRLPIQLQRAMAAEAEATREARAKVSKTPIILLYLALYMFSIIISILQEYMCSIMEILIVV